MKALITISKININASIDCADPVLKEKCRRILENSHERIEHVMVTAVQGEILRLLPGVSITDWDVRFEDQP